MTGQGGGPTRGAYEQTKDRRWEASPALAQVIRVIVYASPTVGAFALLLLVAGLIYRPPGTFGMIVWFVQALIVGTSASMGIERLARRALPLATLFTMSLIFPDQAPSRFAVALRAGTVRKLRERIESQSLDNALGEDVGVASARALQYVTALGRHDRLTRGHTERVRAYADMIAVELGISEADREKLTWGVMLHDIGKIAVPAEILNKVDRLTDDEWAILKEHPEAGRKLLGPLRKWLGPWALAASEHHERWDGTGYPRGLKGEEISLAGRITAVADTYDVITSKRSYKEPMSPAAARRELVLCSGTQFDPDVVRAFLNLAIGHRWSAGVLAAASHIPVANVGTAPVAVSVGAVASVGALVAGVPPAPDPVEELAYAAPTTTVEAPPEASVDLGPPQATTITVTAPGTEPTIGPASTPSSAQSSAPSTTGTMPTTTTGSPSTMMTTTTTTPPTTTVPTTAPPTTPPTTAPPTTGPTTTVPTTAPPTTTTLPPAVAYFLKNPGSDGQDTTAQLFKPLELSGPVDLVQYNFDTNRDPLPGIGLLPTSSGWTESDPARIQRFFLDASDGTLSGPVTLQLWAATDVDGQTVPIRVGIADCPAAWTLGWSCPGPSIIETTANITTWIGDGFQLLTIDLGSPVHTFAADRTLAIRIITEGTERVNFAFDSTAHASRIALSLD